VLECHTTGRDAAEAPCDSVDAWYWTCTVTSNELCSVLYILISVSVCNSAFVLLQRISTAYSIAVTLTHCSLQQASVRLCTTVCRRPCQKYKVGRVTLCPTASAIDAMRSAVARRARSTFSRCQYCTILAQNSSSLRAGSASVEGDPSSQRAARVLLRSAASQQSIAKYLHNS
jgi:hypothetical protein